MRTTLDIDDGVLAAAEELASESKATMEATMFVLVAGGLFYLVVASRSPLAAHAHYSLLLCVVFSNVIQRVRFWYALASSAAVIALSAIAIPKIAALPAEAEMSALMTLATTTILTLVASYTFEQEQRRSYLVGLREELRAGDLITANRELNVISALDPLTGLANRRQLEQFLDTLWVKGDDHLSVAVMMIDIDHFKSFNDHYGHPAGDQCLQAVVSVLREHVRTGDLVARYGGEEFLVVLPCTELIDGVRTAERIRRTLEARAIPHLAAPEPKIVTASIGIAVATPLESPNYDMVIAAADAALYNAKERGRNRVWPPLMTTDTKALMSAYARPELAQGG